MRLWTEQPCSLAGKRVLVAGAAGDIGRAVVEILLQNGAEVLSTDLPGVEPPPGTVHVACDLTDPAAVAALADQLPEELHGLVHCAGITRDGLLWKMPLESWGEVMRVNLDSAFHLLRGALPALRKAGSGSVVLISSINGERGKFGQTNYAASKAGLIGFGKSAARELGAFGIRVNSVTPGWIDTRMTAVLPVEVRQRAIDETALGRVGRPEDVAGAVLFLCSGLSAHVTGQVLRVDGGQLTA